MIYNELKNHEKEGKPIATGVRSFNPVIRTVGKT